uniref:Uncharacterized protein n=1 Tax=Tanacetum cinerariifolium TaxID=118510 RepID=A0A6L2J070_TANCI|nr:hypothetical protein [Tanacetum cinerariifolium]
MMELVMHTEKNDTVFHTEKTEMLRLVVEINVGGMTIDVVDKVTCSFDGWQLKQVDLKYVHALNEPHLHDIHVVPNRHEVDQRFGQLGKRKLHMGRSGRGHGYCSGGGEVHRKGWAIRVRCWPTNRIRGFVQLRFGQGHMGRSGRGHGYCSGGGEVHRKGWVRVVCLGGKSG